MQRAFLRTLLVTCVVFFGFFTLEAWVEWVRLGRPGGAATSWADVNNAKLVDFLSPVARAYNNILAMLLATIGLAIPLTANMHTPKLISIFFDDWVNRVVLLVMAFGAANVLWVDYLIGPHFAPMWTIRFSLGFVLLGWAVLIPYFFYVVRFLDPSEIVIRLRDRATRALRRAPEPGLDVERFQDAVHDVLSQIGTIVLKSLDRGDRGVALEGIWAFKIISDAYGEVKPKMPAASFVVGRHDFVGLSAEALELLNENRTWVERKLLSQLHLCFRAALSKASDIVSSISDATRVIMVHAHERKDVPARDEALRALNSYVRSAIHAKNVHAIYDVFYQYRLFARELREDPDVLVHVTRAFHEYAAACRDSGIEFAAQLASFDLGHIARRAYEAQSPVREHILDEVLAMPHTRKGEPLVLVVKAKLLLGAFFVEHKMDEPGARVREALRDVPLPVLERCERDLLAAERTYFELTDRQVDLEYVPPERRVPLMAFVASSKEASRTASDTG